MVQHMVILKVKPGVSQAQVDALMGELKGLSQKIPGILHFSGGRYSSPEGLNQGFTHGFLMTFETAAARDTYLSHAEHERVKAAIIPNIDDAIAFDYEA
jgi:hypothetical protein